MHDRVEVLARTQDGALTARGVIGLVNRFAAYDQIVTAPENRRRGLGSLIVSASMTHAANAGATQHPLIATRVGRALYSYLGWDFVTDVGSIIARPDVRERPGRQRAEHAGGGRFENWRTLMINLFRRRFLIGSVGLATAATMSRVQAQMAAQPVDLKAKLTYPFVVPPLPYAFDANEPTIDAQTMELHHDKHHAAYVNNLNAALKDHPELHDIPLQDLLARLPSLPEAIRTTVRNNAGGHANHTMFWQVMGGKGGEPTAEMAAAIMRDFGSVDALKASFNKAATGVFGSGWAMILADRDGKLSLVARSNQDSPLMDGMHVVFGNDVWEHAYYLKYQNRRPDYLAGWWNVLDWSRVGERYAAVRDGTLTV